MKVCPVFNKIKAKLFALDKGENGMSQITKKKVLVILFWYGSYFRVRCHFHYMDVTV